MQSKIPILLLHDEAFEGHILAQDCNPHPMLPARQAAGDGHSYFELRRGAAKLDLEGWAVVNDHLQCASGTGSWRVYSFTAS